MENLYRGVGVMVRRGNNLELGTRNLELQPQAGVWGPAFAKAMACQEGKSKVIDC